MPINVTIIDYGLGNLWSVKNAFEFLGANVHISSKPNEILNSDCLILPGVGSFDTGMRNLFERKLIDPLNIAVIDNKKPFLGICLGMQLLSNHSDEGKKVDGLGYIPGNVKKLNIDQFRIPHIGFNEARSTKDSFFSSVLNADFYFVHSYHFVPKNKDHIICSTEYGHEFISGVQNNNIIGTQFHPEKSQSNGLTFLKEFLKFSLTSNQNV